jgi:hypothetical protein
MSMKQIIISLIVLIPALCKSQELATYKDTVNNFTIGVPVGWIYGILKNVPTIKIFARQFKPDSIDHSYANYNLNIFQSHDSSFDNAYATFISGISEAKKFIIISSGELSINEVIYRWIQETHENNNLESLIMKNYVFMTYKNGLSYILTMVVPEKRFDTLKPLFDKIAASLRL